MGAQLVEIRFKGNRKAFYRWHDPEPLGANEPVIVETDRGLDLGHVSATGATASTKCERCAMRALAPAGPGEGGERPHGTPAADRRHRAPPADAAAAPEP
ncbi:MAG: hypothetical protein ACHQ8D_21415, partial [Candidatus Rokuibacteriota bacterium]